MLLLWGSWYIIQLMVDTLYGFTTDNLCKDGNAGELGRSPYTDFEFYLKL